MSREASPIKWRPSEATTCGTSRHLQVDQASSDIKGGTDGPDNERKYASTTSSQTPQHGCRWSLIVAGVSSLPWSWSWSPSPSPLPSPSVVMAVVSSSSVVELSIDSAGERKSVTAAAPRWYGIKSEHLCCCGAVMAYLRLSSAVSASTVLPYSTHSHAIYPQGVCRFGPVGRVRPSVRPSGWLAGCRRSTKMCSVCGVLFARC